MTESSGTGHLQKGHGVSFADWDSDGDLDLFVVLGGGYPGDRGYNALFQNPGTGGTGSRSSSSEPREPLGDRGQDRRRAQGPRRHRGDRFIGSIGNNGSFGGNSLVESIGLGDASRRHADR